MKDIRNEKWDIKELNSLGVFKRYHVLTETPTDKDKLQIDCCYLLISPTDKLQIDCCYLLISPTVKTDSECYMPVKCLMLLDGEIVYFQDIRIDMTPYRSVIKC